MVKSKLSSTVNYPEHKKMNPSDEDFEASVYDTDILGVPVVIAIGQPEDTFLKSDKGTRKSLHPVGPVLFFVIPAKYVVSVSKKFEEK